MERKSVTKNTRRGRSAKNSENLPESPDKDGSFDKDVHTTEEREIVPAVSDTKQEDMAKSPTKETNSDTQRKGEKKAAKVEGEVKSTSKLSNKKKEAEKETEEEVIVTGGSTAKQGVKGRSSRLVSKAVEEFDEAESDFDATKAESEEIRSMVVSKTSKSAKGKTILDSESFGSRTVLSGCACEDEYWDIPALSEVRDMLKFQGWMCLFDKVKNAFVNLVRDFYSNVKQLPDSSVESTVYGRVFNVSVGSLSEVLKIPRDGFDKYCNEGWPVVAGVSFDKIVEFLFVKKTGYKIENLKSPVLLVLHSLCNKVLLPKAQGRGTVRIMDMVLMFLMMKRFKINLPALILEHILYCKKTSYCALPYGSLLSFMFSRETKFPLNGEIVPPQIFSKKILSQKGLDFSSDILRFKRDVSKEKLETLVQEEAGSRKKRKMEEAHVTDLSHVLSRLDAQDVTLKKMMDLISDLSQGYDKKYRKLEKKLAETELLVLNLPEVQEAGVKGSTEKRAGDKKGGAGSSGLKSKLAEAAFENADPVQIAEEAVKEIAGDKDDQASSSETQSMKEESDNEDDDGTAPGKDDSDDAYEDVAGGEEEDDDDED